MELYIKNMVCDRCIMAVKSVLEQNGIAFRTVSLGVAHLSEDIPAGTLSKLNADLNRIGFEIIDDRRNRVAEQVKTEIIGWLYHRTSPLLPQKINLSEYLSERLHTEYGTLSSLFSETQGITIEKYFIAQKIERVKELLMYDELTLSQIADELGYSSVAHLSSQFKQVTGITPTRFKQTHPGRKPLDRI